MKTWCLLLLIAVAALSLFAAYNIGDKVDNFSFTQNNGATTSVYDIIASGKVLLIFWGDPG